MKSLVVEKYGNDRIAQAGGTTTEYFLGDAPCGSWRTSPKGMLSAGRSCWHGPMIRMA
jgi:hypothetical protein